MAVRRPRGGPARAPSDQIRRTGDRGGEDARPVTVTAATKEMAESTAVSTRAVWYATETGSGLRSSSRTKAGARSCEQQSPACLAVDSVAAALDESCCPVDGRGQQACGSKDVHGLGAQRQRPATSMRIARARPADPSFMTRCVRHENDRRVRRRAGGSPDPPPRPPRWCASPACPCLLEASGVPVSKKALKSLKKARGELLDRFPLHRKRINGRRRLRDGKSCALDVLSRGCSRPLARLLPPPGTGSAEPGHANRERLSLK